MMLPRDVLAHYVERHNRAVHSGDFAPLIEMFSDGARLEGVKGGPFAGKSAIARAFSAPPPADELVLLETREPESDVIEADYAWRAQRSRKAGSLRLELSGASITRLVIRAD